MALRHGDARVPGEEWVCRGTPLGNPFVVRGGESADEAVAGYWELLGGRRSVHAIGRDRGLVVHESQGRVTHERRAGALDRLVSRVVSGEAVAVRCPCRCDTCHAFAVREWVTRAVAARAREAAA